MGKKIIRYIEIFMLITGLLSLPSCTIKEQAYVPQDSSIQTQEEMLNNYLLLLLTLDKSNINSSKVAVNELSLWTTPIPDEAIRALMEFLEEFSHEINYVEFPNGYSAYYADRKDYHEGSLEELNEVYSEYYLSVLRSEGYDYCYPDWAQMGQTLKNNEITQLYADLFVIFEVEKVRGFTQLVSDGALIVKWNDLVDYLVVRQNLLDTYPNSYEINEMKQTQNHFIYILDGSYVLPNTSIFPYWENNTLDKEVKESYIYLIATYPNSSLVPRFKALLELHERNGYKQTQEVKQYLAALEPHNK